MSSYLLPSVSKVVLCIIYGPQRERITTTTHGSLIIVHIMGSIAIPSSDTDPYSWRNLDDLGTTCCSIGRDESSEPRCSRLRGTRSICAPFPASVSILPESMLHSNWTKPNRTNRQTLQCGSIHVNAVSASSGHCSFVGLGISTMDT